MLHTDVCDYLPRIAAPTLVLHRRDDNAVPIAAGRRVASLIPNARFVPLEGDHHLPYFANAESVLRAIDEFLGIEPAPIAPAAPLATAEAPVTVLFTDLEGSTA